MKKRPIFHVDRSIPGRAASPAPPRASRPAASSPRPSHPSRCLLSPVASGPHLQPGRAGHSARARPGFRRVPPAPDGRQRAGCARLSLPGRTCASHGACAGLSLLRRGKLGAFSTRRAAPPQGQTASPAPVSGASLQRQTGRAGGFRRQAPPCPEAGAGRGRAGCACSPAGRFPGVCGQKTKKTHSAVYLVCISPVYTVCLGLNQSGLIVRLIWSGHPARPPCASGQRLRGFRHSER